MAPDPPGQVILPFVTAPKTSAGTQPSSVAALHEYAGKPAPRFAAGRPASWTDAVQHVGKKMPDAGT